MGNRDAGRGGCSHSGTHARYDGEGHSRRMSRERLLATAPEDEWVPALQSNDELAGAGLRAEEIVDLRLTHLLSPAPLADVDQLRVRRCEVEQRRVHEPVVNDDVRGANGVTAGERQQARVS